MTSQHSSGSVTFLTAGTGTSSRSSWRISFYKQIEALQLDPEYAFEEVPMPYDITINAIGAGDIKVKYTVVPASSNTALTPAEKALLIGAQPIR